MPYTEADLYREIAYEIRYLIIAKKPISLGVILDDLATRHPDDGFTELCRRETVAEKMLPDPLSRRWSQIAQDFEHRAAGGDELQLANRNAAVAEIVRRHLDAIHNEIARYDEHMLLIDNAGDRAEIAHQVLEALVEQLRGFGRGARLELREKEAWLLGTDEEANG